MKICPGCSSPIRRYLSRCPFCGYRYSVVEMIVESFLYLILVALVLFIAVAIMLILLDFRFYRN